MQLKQPVPYKSLTPNPFIKFAVQYACTSYQFFFFFHLQIINLNWIKSELIWYARKNLLVISNHRVLHFVYKHLPDCPGQVRVRFGQAFWKTKKVQLPVLGKLKKKIWTNSWYSTNQLIHKNKLLFFLGQVKMSFGQVIFIRFVLSF